MADEPAGEVVAVQERAVAGEQGDAGFEGVEPGGARAADALSPACQNSLINLDGCGGQSFTANTKVLLASGKAVPIAALKPGDKILATNTKTGKTQPEPVAAVLVHHDTDLYNLTIKSGSRTSVIRTTHSHLFWVPYHHYWVPANKLSKGEHLRSPGGTTVTVVGGTSPAGHDGWMWDLTIPGDHDFYIDTLAAPVLVHNETCGGPDTTPGGRTYSTHYLNDTGPLRNIPW